MNIALDAVLHPVSTTVQKSVQQQQVAASKANDVKEKELSSQEWFELGNKHHSGNDFNEAIRCYTEALRLQPNWSRAYYRRGLTYHDKGNLNNAIKDYTNAIHLKPDYALAYLGRGEIWMDKKDYYLAVADFQKYLDVGGPDELVRQSLKNAKAKIVK